MFSLSPLSSSSSENSSSLLSSLKLWCPLLSAFLCSSNNNFWAFRKFVQILIVRTEEKKSLAFLCSAPIPAVPPPFSISTTLCRATLALRAAFAFSFSWKFFIVCCRCVTCCCTCLLRVCDRRSGSGFLSESDVKSPVGVWSGSSLGSGGGRRVHWGCESEMRVWIESWLMRTSSVWTVSSEKTSSCPIAPPPCPPAGVVSGGMRAALTRMIRARRLKERVQLLQTPR